MTKLENWTGESDDLEMIQRHFGASKGYRMPYAVDIVIADAPG